MFGQGRQRTATAIGALAVLLWSALALLTTLTAGIPPFELLTLGFGIAFLAGLALLAARGPAALAKLRQPRRAWALSFFGLFLYHALYFLALKSAPPAVANLINYLWPLLIVLLAGLLGGRLLPRHALGAAMGLAATVVLLRPHLGSSPGDAGLAAAGGYAAAFVAAFVWAAYSVLNRRFAAVPSEMIIGVCGAVSLAGLLCHLALEPAVLPTPAQWAAIIGLGIGPVGLAFLAWDHATKHGDLAVLGTIAYAAPLLSTALLVLAGRAAPSAALFVAAGLVIGGAVVATRKGKAKEAVLS
jgi:drug/metabolite transporter (DMT)-like permease